MMANNVVLVETLALAVPMRIDQLQQYREATRTEVGLAWAKTGADLVACHGDMLQFRSKAPKKHTTDCVKNERQTYCDCLIGTAEVFNAMAKGLAALALSPGGVTFSGLHWCVEHPGGKRVQVERDGRPFMDSYSDLGCSAHGWDEPDLPRMPTWQPFGGRPVVTVELPEAVL